MPPIELMLFAVPPPPLPVTTDSLTPLYFLVGTSVVGQLIAMGFGVVKWLGSRTVEREDKDKQKLEERIDKLEKTFAETERTLLNMGADVKAVSTSIETIRTTVAELRTNLETRFDKQSEFYRGQMKEMLTNVTEKLEKMEYELRQDTTRAIHDAQVMMQQAKKR